MHGVGVGFVSLRRRRSRCGARGPEIIIFPSENYYYPSSWPPILVPHKFVKSRKSARRGGNLRGGYQSSGLCMVYDLGISGRRQ